jgi:hypothetical protein
MITLLDVWLVALTLAVGDWFFGYGVLGIDRGATVRGIIAELSVAAALTILGGIRSFRERRRAR